MGLAAIAVVLLLLAAAFFISKSEKLDFTKKRSFLIIILGMFCGILLY